MILLGKFCQDYEPVQISGSRNEGHHTARMVADLGRPVSISTGRPSPDKSASRNVAFVNAVC
jgi:hypothetical protein